MADVNDRSTTISTFINDSGQTVHAVFAQSSTSDGRMVNRHYGTYASQGEALQRIAQIQSGVADRQWDEPE